MEIKIFKRRRKFQLDFLYSVSKGSRSVFSRFNVFLFWLELFNFHSDEEKNQVKWKIYLSVKELYFYSFGLSFMWYMVWMLNLIEQSILSLLCGHFINKGIYSAAPSYCHRLFEMDCVIILIHHSRYSQTSLSYCFFCLVLLQSPIWPGVNSNSVSYIMVL